MSTLSAQMMTTTALVAGELPLSASIVEERELLSNKNLGIASEYVRGKKGKSRLPKASLQDVTVAQIVGEVKDVFAAGSAVELNQEKLHARLSQLKGIRPDIYQNFTNQLSKFQTPENRAVAQKIQTLMKDGPKAESKPEPVKPPPPPNPTWVSTFNPGNALGIRFTGATDLPAELNFLAALAPNHRLAELRFGLQFPLGKLAVGETELRAGAWRVAGRPGESAKGSITWNVGFNLGLVDPYGRNRPLQLLGARRSSAGITVDTLGMGDSGPLVRLGFYRRDQLTRCVDKACRFELGLYTALGDKLTVRAVAGNEPLSLNPDVASPLATPESMTTPNVTSFVGFTFQYNPKGFLKNSPTDFTKPLPGFRPGEALPHLLGLVALTEIGAAQSLQMTYAANNAVLLGINNDQASFKLNNFKILGAEATGGVRTSNIGTEDGEFLRRAWVSGKMRWPLLASWAAYKVGTAIPQIYLASSLESDTSAGQTPEEWIASGKWGYMTDFDSRAAGMTLASVGASAGITVMDILTPRGDSKRARGARIGIATGQLLLGAACTIAGNRIAGQPNSVLFEDWGGSGTVELAERIKGVERGYMIRNSCVALGWTGGKTLGMEVATAIKDAWGRRRRR